jgi:hypothetical protein
LWCFSPAEQGYHYTFMALAAGFGFFELGLSVLLTNFAAHAWAQRGGAQADAHAMSYLSSLFRKALAWYAALTCLAWPLITSLGYMLLRGGSGTLSSSVWQRAWSMFSLASAVALMLTPAWAFLSACGKHESVVRYRLVEVAVRNGVLWGALTTGAGLFASSLAALAVLLVSVAFLLVHRPLFNSLFRAGETRGATLRWWSDVFPTQWRLGISWVCGYISLMLFAPFSFWYFGPEAAGAVGLTWALSSGISMLAASWATAKVPHFAALAARNAYGDLSQLVDSTNRTAVIVSAGLGLLTLFIFVVIKHVSPPIASRFLPLQGIAFFLAADPLMQVATVQSQTLRAFRTEAFLPASLAFAAAIVLSVPISLTYLGPTGVALSYFLGVLAMFICGRQIFNAHRKGWGS